MRIFAAVKAYLVNDYISDFTNRNIIVEKPIFIVSRGSTFSKCSNKHKSAEVLSIFPLTDISCKNLVTNCLDLTRKLSTPMFKEKLDSL